MPEANEVETLETTETAEEHEVTDNETQEPLSTFEQAFNLDAMRDEEETLAKEREERYANENETNSENNEEEVIDEPEENSVTTFEFKSGETSEKYDLSKEEDRKKLEQYFEFGRHGSQKLGEVNEKEKMLKGRESSLEASSNLILNQYLKNVVSGIEIVEKPDLAEYYDQVSDEYETKKYESKEKAKEQFKQDNVKYEQIDEMRKNFKANEQKATEEYTKNLNEFVDKYPEYKDTAKFNELLKSDVQPIYNALTSMGSVPLPKSFFEMIHFYKNKDKVIQDAITADRKKRLNNTTKVTQPVANGRKASNNSVKELSEADKTFRTAFPMDKYR